MGKSSQEKINYAIELLKKGKTFREIQAILQKKFHSSMSFSTLTKLKKILSEKNDQSQRITLLEKELALFKKLYFDLLEKVNNSKGEHADLINNISKKDKRGDP